MVGCKGEADKTTSAANGSGNSANGGRVIGRSTTVDGFSA